MKILALEPYYGGSHRAFLDAWSSRSRHDWTLLTLPDTKWKWRMRHSAVTFAQQTAQAMADGASWDLVFCSDMLNLAEFLGLAPPALHALPAVAYFHENQLTYPVERPTDYDYHFAFSNMNTGLAATRCWFNSAFHRDTFLDALDVFLRRMPDCRPLAAVGAIRERADVRPPGITLPAARAARTPGPAHLLWAARWEFDKAPERFFRALERVDDKGVPFRLSVVGGGSGREILPIFEWARQRFAGQIVHWGYQESREDYEAVLAEADLVVSTSDHEFFGLSVVEAIAAGAFPLVPRRLAYPEVLGDMDDPHGPSCFYTGGEGALARHLRDLIWRAEHGTLWGADRWRGRKHVQQYVWEHLVPAWDDEVERLRR